MEKVLEEDFVELREAYSSAKVPIGDVVALGYDIAGDSVGDAPPIIVVAFVFPYPVFVLRQLEFTPLLVRCTFPWVTWRNG